MKKTIIFHLLLILLLLYSTGCQPAQEKEVQKTLSDFQITACNAADEAGTCDTRLIEVGIVMEEDCCEVLGRCC